MTGDDRRRGAEAVRGLYAILDVAPGEPTPTPLAAALLDGGCRVVQLRQKRGGAGQMLAHALALRPLLHARGALLIVNDRLDVALAAAADGVHLGQGDLPPDRARALAPPGLLVGVSTHGLAEARLAVAQGVDYVGFGPIFPTATKPDHSPVVGLAGLTAACREISVPVVAIGGISLSSVPDVARAGAAAAALISALRQADDPARAARDVNRCFVGEE